MFETTYGMTGHFRLPGLTLATNLTDFAKSMEITTFSGPWKLSTAVSTQIWGDAPIQACMGTHGKVPGSNMSTNE